MWSDAEELLDFSDGDASDADLASAPAVIEDPEVWMDYWSEELLDLWHSVQDQCSARGLAILDAAKFPDFAQFCFQFSSGYPPAA